MPTITLDLEDNYSLIALHSSEEDYRLAFLLNNLLKIKLTRFKNNLDFADSNAQFSLFEFKDEYHFLTYFLINNKDLHDEVPNKIKTGLFKESINTISYLIPEKKSVDFFLKIEGETDSVFIKNTLKKLNTMQQIITSYLIDNTTLKSKDHLIF